MKPTPPELSGPPVVGHAFEFLRDRSSVLQRGLTSLGPVFTVRLFHRRIAILIGPEYHQMFFEETNRRLSLHKAFEFLKATFGEVGIAAPPEMYDQHRPVTLTAFRSGKMTHYISVMQYEVQRWLDLLGERGEINLFSEISRLTQNVAVHALMGEAFHKQTNREFWDLYQCLEDAFHPFLPPHLPLPKFIRRDRAKKKLEALLQPILVERRANPDSFDDFLQDFVTARDRDGRLVGDETIIGLILSLIFAGYVTTIAQTVWTITQLLQAPDYLRMVQQEINEYVPSDQPITSNILSSLKHVFWAVQETTRMRPSADVIPRKVMEDIDFGDYRIPKGWMVLICPGLTQKLPTLFTEPQKYDPLRFAPGREENRRHRFSITTFGWGTHRCLGMNFAQNEIMIVMSLLLQQFELELLTKDPRNADGPGIGRPEKIMVRYVRKRKNNAAGSVHSVPATSCPHMQSVLDASQTTEVSRECSVPD